MYEIIKNFSELLNEQLATNIPMSEDAVRRTFINAIISNGEYKPSNIVIEQKHPVIKGARIDLFISKTADRQSAAMEFKYDRSIPSGKNQPRTEKAGAVYNDIFRLANIPTEFAPLKVVIYLTDLEMATYFRNPDNMLEALFELPQGEAIRIDTSLMTNVPSSFLKKITCPLIDCVLVGAFSEELIQDHSLRVYYVFSDYIFKE